MGRVPHRILPALLVALAAGVPPTASATASAPSPASPPAAMADFNADGFGDLAVGVPFEDIGGARDAGAVNVLYGSETGLPGFSQILRQRSSSNTAPEADDQFGFSLAAGDFDGDGDTDLAVGSPFETLDGVGEAGMVSVFSGGPGGLATDHVSWSQDPFLTGANEEGDVFGYSLAAGDFDGDGHFDLAVGAPGEDVGEEHDAGHVNVLYGTSGGLSSGGNQGWSQRKPGVAGAAEAGDCFGYSLVAGDFDGDGRDDLAIGVPGEIVGELEGDVRIGGEGDGAVNVLYGGADGLSADGDQIWHQDRPNVAGAAEQEDNFGWSLATGDFNGDGRFDLAIGVPEEALDGTRDAGAVNVLYGSADGLHTGGNEVWHQDTAGIVGGAEAFDHFGSSLAAGDFDGDGRDDLAVGVPGENLDGTTDAGMVNVIYGSAAGLSADGNEVWHQDKPGVEGAAERGDVFGSSVATGDFDGNGRADLAVGVPFEDRGDIANSGAVNVLYGRLPGGLAAADNQALDQDSPAVADEAEAGDKFGSAVTAVALGAG